MRTVLLGGALLFSSAALSQEGPYVGFKLGVFDFEETISPPTFSFSDTAPVYSLYGGYRFNDRWAVEGTLVTTSDLKDELFGVTPGSISIDMFEIRGLAHFGSFLVGLGYWDSIDFSTSSMLAGPGGNGLSFILGGEWSLNDDWKVRVEAEVFDTEDLDLSFFSLDQSTDAASISVGAHYKFGGR